MGRSCKDSKPLNPTISVFSFISFKNRSVLLFGSLSINGHLFVKVWTKKIYHVKRIKKVGIFKFYKSLKECNVTVLQQ